MDPVFGQLTMRRSCSLTNRSNPTANPVTRGFWRPTSTFPRNCRQCVFPSDAEGMNHGTEDRFHEGSGANSR